MQLLIHLFVLWLLHLLAHNFFIAVAAYGADEYP